MMLVALFVLLVFMLGIYLGKKPKNFPPGPSWLPIIGCSLHVGKQVKLAGGRQHVMLQELSKKWNSNVVGLKLGEQLIVTVSTYPLIKKFLDSEDFSARPNNFFGRLRSFGDNIGITNAEGKIFIEQKKFLLRVVAKFSIEQKVKEEMDDLVRLINLDNENVEFGKLIKPPILNTIWSIVAGKGFNRFDRKVQELLRLLDERNYAFDMSGALLSGYPWLRFVAPDYVGYNLIMKLNGAMTELIMAAINDHRQSWSQGKNEDFLYSFISRMHDGRGETNSFTEKQLIMVCIDMFLGGTHTIGPTLDFLCLMMLSHPEIQDRVQKDLDDEFPHDHSIHYSDRHKVPFVEAVINEVTRYCHVFPLGGPRRAIRKTEIEGYTIPKDTTVLFNLHTISMSKEIWGDPEKFRPERFMNGRRRCVGEMLAKKMLFLYFSEIIRKYRILPMADQPLLSHLPQGGIVAVPQYYKARFIPRKIIH
ncbi:hypothetical protein RI129_011424 [Pyrocoelia pectoralis]|uniref:Cytochrome P450 n=1 Tax=Pyrocoelia pectoralis TaxID=417401 RepID=A0AAN7ZIR6_9COLE